MPAADRASTAVASPPPADTIAQTSVDQYQQSETTIRFRRWAMHGNTAYLRGQEAGFSRPEAEMLVRRGLGDVVHLRSAETVMVTK